MLFSVEQAFVGREEIRAPLKTPAWEATPRLAFLAWDGFHARSRFARSTVPEEKWGTTRSLEKKGNVLKPHRVKQPESFKH